MLGQASTGKDLLGQVRSGNIRLVQVRFVWTGYGMFGQVCSSYSSLGEVITV